MALGLGVSQELSKPAHCLMYPLLYNHRALVNDFLLREVVELLRMRGQGALVTPIGEWMPDSADASGLSLDEGGGVLLCLSDANVRHVGGMLMAGENEFLFDAMPFIEKRVKDVRCRFGFDDAVTNDDDDADVKAALARAKRDKDLLGSPAVAAGAAATAAAVGGSSPERYHYDSERSRVYFMLCEYTGIGDDSDWVVQTFQLIGNTGPYGKVVYRAHLTGQAAARLKHARLAAQAASSPGPDGDLGGDGIGAAARMPIPGEQYLREHDPHLLAWCLQRDPIEMGAAARVIVNVIEYYKFSFTVMRTCKSLIRSIRCMQRFARRFLAGRDAAELRMLRDWRAEEAAFRRRLEAHVSLPGDQVDRIVNKMLLKHCMTDTAFKQRVIREKWEDRKLRYRRERELGGVGSAALEALQGKFSWTLPIDELVAVNQARLVDLLSATHTGVFAHRNVQALFIDSVGDAEILKQAVAEARDMQARELNGRRVPAFGSTTSRFTGGAERSLEIHVPLSAPTIPSWDPRNYEDKPIDPNDTPEPSEADATETSRATTPGDDSSGAAAPQQRMAASAESLSVSPGMTPQNAAAALARRGQQLKVGAPKKSSSSPRNTGKTQATTKR